jgi:heat shock protein HtpX
MSETSPIIVATDFRSDAISDFSKFFEQHYIRPYQRAIESDTYRRVDQEGVTTFSWNLNLSEISPAFSLHCELKIFGGTIELFFQDQINESPFQGKIKERVADDILVVVRAFIQTTMANTLYFVIGGGSEKDSEAPTHGSNGRGLLRTILTGNSNNVFLLLTFVGFVLFFAVGLPALFFLLATQLVYLACSDKIILNVGNVRPDLENPLVSIVGVRTKPEIAKFLRLHGKNIVREIRDDVSKLHVTLSADGSNFKAGSELKPSIISTLSRYGVSTSLEDIELKTRNVYALVKQVAEKFSQPSPKIVIANSIISNASATGISKKRSSIMITAGSLQELSDEELESTIGHELGHVKGHDPSILFGLTSFQFIGMFYLWYPLVVYLGLFYFIIAFGIIFACGKVLETRADTESALVLGNPEILAESLRKIGFSELYREKYSSLRRLLDWFRFDPHPPIYFRINRMSEFMGGKSQTKHAFWISLKDCVVGFFSAFQ